MYPTFLKKLLPVFTKLLEGPPVFVSTSWIHVSFHMISVEHHGSLLTSASAVTKLHPGNHTSPAYESSFGCNEAVRLGPR